MRLISLLASIVVILAILTLGISFPVRGAYARKAKLIQRVEKPAGDDLFGEGGTIIASAQMLIIDDSHAFIGEPKAGEPYSVDEKYLKDHNVYPLQLKTVDFFVDYSRLGAGIALILAGLTWAFATRRIKAGLPVAMSQS